jgi:hypothetical protein
MLRDRGFFFVPRSSFLEPRAFLLFFDVFYARVPDDGGIFRKIAVHPHRINNPDFSLHDIANDDAVLAGPAVTHLNEGRFVEDGRGSPARFRKLPFLRLRNPVNCGQH